MDVLHYDHIEITLSDEETAWVDKHVGNARRDAAIKRGRLPRAGAPTDDATARAMDILGARCEAAAYKWAKPVKWHWKILDDVKGLPDLDEFIDVKGVDEADHRLIVKTDDIPTWAYLLVYGHQHPLYTVSGWCWGREAMATALQQGSPGRYAHFIQRGDLRDPLELLDELRFRQ